MRLLRRGTGNPILFIHGIPTSHHLWDGVIQRLDGQFTCYMVDLPGFGDEPRGDCGVGQLPKIAEEIERLRAEAGVERWHVVGHDAGSAIAALYASMFAERVERLVLMSSPLFPDLRPYFLFQWLRRRVLGEVLAPCLYPIIWRVAMRRACQDGNGDVHQALTAFQMPFRGPLGPWQMMRVVRWGRPSQVLGEIPTLLSELQCPTLIVHGANDPAIPVTFAHRACALIPNSRLAIVEAGHFIPVNCPEPVSRHLEEFFSGCDVAKDGLPIPTGSESFPFQSGPSRVMSQA